jgi:hypothetical protein
VAVDLTHQLDGAALTGEPGLDFGECGERFHSGLPVKRLVSRPIIPNVIHQI